MTLMLLVGCVAPPPIARGAAAGIADNVQRAHSLDWGDPVEVLPPSAPDAQGHCWWQLRYAGTPPRLILVDAETGWGRLPSADYVPRGQVHMPPSPLPARAPMLQDGSFIYCLKPPAELGDGGVAELEREAARLNALAATTNLYPLFSVRTDHAGKSALIYGWQGDRGMAQDERLGQWIALRTAYAPTAYWSDLLPR
jgi:hypothetical protein